MPRLSPRKAVEEGPINPKAPGQRFKNGERASRGTVFDKMPKGMGPKRNKKGEKVCDVCGKPWNGTLRVIWGKDGKRCEHGAGSRGPMSETDRAIRNMHGNLKPNEVAVKGNDGLVRIYG